MFTQVNPYHGPLSVSALRDPSDATLVRDFLEAVDGFSQEEVERRVGGVTQNDLSRWRRGEWKRITAAKRRALQDFLRAHRRGQYVIRAAGLTGDLEDVRGDLASLPTQRAKLDALDALKELLILRGPLPEWWHRLRQEIEGEAP